MNNKGYGLIGMLAVIVIIAIGLMIIVPKMSGSKEQKDLINDIMDITPNDNNNTNTSVIGTVKLAGMKDSAIMILNTAERYYQTAVILDENLSSIECVDIIDLGSDFSECTIKYDDNGKPSILLKASETGKFKDYTCKGTKDNLECSK